MSKRKLLNSVSTNSGFTLLELLVVVILVAILAGIAAPGWLGYLNRQRLTRARNDLIQVLEQAQTDAQQQNSTRVVSISSSNPPQVEVSSTPGADGVIRELGEQNSGLLLVGGPLSSGPVASVAFDHRGLVDGDSVPFIFSVTSDNLGTDQVRCVIVPNLLGSIIRADDNNCVPTPYRE